MFMQSPVEDINNRVKNVKLTSRQLIECRRQKKLQSIHASRDSHKNKDVEEHCHNKTATLQKKKKQRSTFNVADDC